MVINNVRCFHPLPKEFEGNYIKAVNTMEKWLIKNVGHRTEHRWEKLQNGFVIERPEDVLAFKLRFGL